MVTVDAADPARLSPDTLPAMDMPPELRRKTQSACDGGLAIDYAFQLADMAYDMLPVCQAIDADLHRNKVMALNACLLLSGDRAAAGHALSLSNGISKAMNIYPEDIAQTEKALTQLIVLPDPNNRPKAGSNRISQGKRAELVELLRQGDIYNQTYKGIDADHVEIDAIQVQRSENPDGTKWPQRKLTIFASREAGQFRIYAIDATEFEIVQIANASEEGQSDDHNIRTSTASLHYDYTRRQCLCDIPLGRRCHGLAACRGAFVFTRHRCWRAVGSRRVRRD